jgi:hypothetical protein
MMTMKKRLIIGVIALVCVVSISVWLFYVPPSWRQVISRCTNYNPQWLDMVDCYGVISIHWNDNGSYDLLNNVDPGWTVAEIQSPTDFHFSDGQMYLIDVRTPVICNKLKPGKYCGEFEVNGQSKPYYYNTPKDVPRYLIIDTKTGNERFFVTLNDVPNAEQQFFGSLSR